MILGFGDKETEKIYNREFSRKLPQAIQITAFRKLVYMDNAKILDDLRVPPANRFEQWSIRINSQYRICFTVRDNGFDNVTITDYH